MNNRRTLWALATLSAGVSVVGANACGSSSDGSSGATGAGPDGGSIASGAAGNAGGAGAGASGAGATGGALPASGITCASDADCGGTYPYCDTAGTECVQCLTSSDCTGGTCDPASHSCAGGGAGGGTGGGAGGGGTTLSGGPRFPGSGVGAGIPLQPGFGPNTAGDCPPIDGMGTSTATQVRDNATLCFYGEDPTPAATIEQVIEVVDGVEYIHLRVTFNPTFADNTYGAGSVGWGGKDGIRDFGKLVSSDHLELLLTDCAGDTVMQFKVDYINEDPTAPSGYSTGGVTDGDGEVITGDPAAILAVATSIDRNLNGCGYVDYVADSPTTDETFASNPDTPNWDYRVAYEVWVDASAFEQCFGQAYVEFVHASPAKTSSDTITVEGGPCPPDWDTPYCVDPSGANCGGTTTDGGAPPPCPQNYTTFAACPTECVPIPFAGYANRAACPDGYVLDLASEGQYCVPQSGEVCL